MMPLVPLVAIVMMVIDGPSGPAIAAERVAAVVYRGTPAGVPQLNDLAAIRALGFSAVLWPSRFQNRSQAVREMGMTVGLEVIVASDAAPLAPSDGRITRIDVSESVMTEARAWRALQEGARIVAFDSGSREGAGLDDGAGGIRSWVAPARAFARQLAANAALFDSVVAQPPVQVEPDNRDVRVSLFKADRSWMLVATNTSLRAARLTGRLPAGVPAALWISLLDGSGMSMPESTAGPTWTFEIDAGAALVYVIDRSS
jgi:hypothetical protein